MEEDWKVLLIDDDAGIRRVVALALEDAGYTVLTAPDGESGIKLCEEQSPQIVITDIGMPGIDGLEVLRRIKEMDPDKEVIVATAFTEIALAIKALQLDASGFVTKPVSDDSLAFALKRARQRYAKRKDLRDYMVLMEEKWMDTAEELARTFLFQKMLIESSIDGIVACDRQGKVIIFNQSMERMLGYPGEKVVGKMSLQQLFPPEESVRMQDKLASAEQSGTNRLFPFDTELLGSDGRRVAVLLSATVLFQEDVKIGLVVFFRDLQPPPRPQAADESA